MKSKYIFLLLIIVVITALFTSCSKDNPVNIPLDTETFKYPLKDGNYWIYKCTLTYSDFKPDSIKKYITNPSVSEVKVSVLYDTVINSVTTKCLQEETIRLGINRKSWQYYINTDSALLLYAGRGISSMMPKDKKEPPALYLYEPPQKVLLYPVVAGKTWHTDTSTYATKKYISFENVNTPVGTISCMKTERSYSYTPDEFIYYDYFSKKGLIKQYTSFNDMEVSSEQFPEGLGTADMAFDIIVSQFNVSP